MEENPRIDLVLNDVTVVEALRALERASGTRMRPLTRADVPPGKEMTPRLEAFLTRMEERGSYRWEGVRLAEALRDLAARIGLEVHPWIGGYNVGPSDETGERGPRPRLVPFEAEGIRILPHHAGRSTVNAWHYLSGWRHQETGSLSLSLLCRLDGDDIHRVAGIGDVHATDHLGRELHARRLPRVDMQAGGFGPYPDEREFALLFRSLPGDATRLAELEADLYFYRRCEPIRIEFALPLPPEGAIHEAGDIRVELFEVARDRKGNLAVRARLLKPAGVSVSTRRENDAVRAELLDGAGRMFEPDFVGDTGMSRPEADEVEIETGYHASEEPPAAVVFDLYRLEHPEKRLTFHLRDIPLP